MAKQVRDIGSPLSTAVAVFQNMLYMAVRRAQNNEVNILRFDGLHWAELGSVPGVRTPSPPALATFEGKLYLAVRGEDNHLYLASFDGANWSPPERAPGVGKTLSTPALAEFGSLLHLIYNTETDYRVKWVAFNPTFKYGTYTIKPGETDLRQVSSAVFGGNPNRYKELAALNHIEPLPGTENYPVEAGDVLLTPAG